MVTMLVHLGVTGAILYHDGSRRPEKGRSIRPTYQYAFCEKIHPTIMDDLDDEL